MKIAMTGAAGFLGRILSNSLIEKGFVLKGIDIAPPNNQIQNQSFEYIQADTKYPGEWQKPVNEADAVINLAGKNIFGLWTPAYRKEIYDSRILTTKNIVSALKKGATLINASAVGYYGDREDETIFEDAPNGNDYLANVCRDWEFEAETASSVAARIVILRFGIIIGKNGGALKKMLPAYKMGLGGPIGSGSQWFPWIHTDDVAEIIHKSLSSDMTGAYNACSPGLITQAQLSEGIAKTVGMPDYFRIPKILVKTLLGDLGNAITSSQKAFPKKLMDSGFEFKYKNIIEALSDSI